MAKAPDEQQATDAGRIPEHGTGTTDEDTEQLVEAPEADPEADEQEPPEESASPERPQ